MSELTTPAPTPTVLRQRDWSIEAGRVHVKIHRHMGNRNAMHSSLFVKGGSTQQVLEDIDYKDLLALQKLINHVVSDWDNV